MPGERQTTIKTDEELGLEGELKVTGQDLEDGTTLRRTQGLERSGRRERGFSMPSPRPQGIQQPVV